MTDIKYVLQPHLLAPPPEQPITHDQFGALRSARKVLIAAFDFEESFDLLVSNYVEMEDAGLSLALGATVRRRLRRYQDMHEMRAELNRRVVNFLSSARLFIDYLPQRAEDCGVDKAIVAALRSAEYDKHFEYRFMEALRNYVQHRGLAVHSMGVDSKWLPPGERLYQESHLRVQAVRLYLAADGNFNARVLRECPERVDILEASRHYLESLASVQSQIRQLIKDSVAAARQMTKGAIESYVASTNGASPLGLEAKVLDGEDQIESVPVFLDWDDVRLELERRNDGFTNLRLRRVTSGPSIFRT